MVATLSVFNACLDPTQQLTAAAALRLTQKDLSRRINSAGWQAQFQAVSAVGKAMLLSEITPGARAFLTCAPSGRTRMEPAVFVAEIRVRLGIAEATADTWRPKYDIILYIIGGERTLRHNILRDLILN